jgi:DNA-binding GntR family transcriptional regulator
MKQHRIYHELRRAIYTGKIKPGEKLVERRLAREFATSRGPLRESLLRLMSEGLVRRSPRRTCYVEELTLQDVYDIYLMRLTLEPTATRLAARAHNRELVRKLEKIVQRLATCVERGRTDESAEADYDFHREIVLASGSPRLIRAYDVAHVPMLISQLSAHWGRADVLRDLHLELVSLLRAGAADEAEAAARVHVENAFQQNVHLRNLILGKTPLSPSPNRTPA